MLIGLPLVVACTTPKPAMVDAQLSEQSGYEQQPKGLRIFIRPLRDKNEIKRYFGADLLAKNILPVFVSAENMSTSSFFWSNLRMYIGGTKIGPAKPPEGLRAAVT